MADMTCLAEGVVYPADFNKTGLNLNELVVGGTGCGKSVSVAYSRLVHTVNSSVVVPMTKVALKKKFAAMFRWMVYPSETIPPILFVRKQTGICLSENVLNVDF